MGKKTVLNLFLVFCARMTMSLRLCRLLPLTSSAMDKSPALPSDPATVSSSSTLEESTLIFLKISLERKCKILSFASVSGGFVPPPPLTCAPLRTLAAAGWRPRQDTLFLRPHSLQRILYGPTEKKAKKETIYVLLFTHVSLAKKHLFSGDPAGPGRPLSDTLVWHPPGGLGTDLSLRIARILFG